VASSGSDLSEELVVAVEPAAVDCMVAPRCPPGPAAYRCSSRIMSRQMWSARRRFRAAPCLLVSFAGANSRPETTGPIPPTLIKWLPGRGDGLGYLSGEDLLAAGLPGESPQSGHGRVACGPPGPAPPAGHRPAAQRQWLREIFGAPPGNRSLNTACNWLTSRVRCVLKLVRRSSSKASTVVMSSASTGLASPCRASQVKNSRDSGTAIAFKLILSGYFLRLHQ
jgi:hypothetical protein